MCNIHSHLRSWRWTAAATKPSAICARETFDSQANCFRKVIRPNIAEETDFVSPTCTKRETASHLGEESSDEPEMSFSASYSDVPGLREGRQAGIYCTLLMTPTPVVPLAPVSVVNGEPVTGVRVTAPPETVTV